MALRRMGNFGHAFPFEPLWDSRKRWDYTAHILITLGRTPQESPRVGSRARKLPDQTQTTAGRNCENGTRRSQSQHQDTPAWQVLHCGEAGRAYSEPKLAHGLLTGTLERERATFTTTRHKGKAPAERPSQVIRHGHRVRYMVTKSVRIWCPETLRVARNARCDVDQRSAEPGLEVSEVQA
jgi:hypothetical protein